MGMGGGEEERIEQQTDNDSEIAAKHAINKKAKNKFLRNRRDHHREHDNHNALANRLGTGEKIDNLLLARTTAEKVLCQCLSEQNQWRAREQQHDRGAK